MKNEQTLNKNTLYNQFFNTYNEMQYIIISTYSI